MIRGRRLKLIELNAEERRALAALQKQGSESEKLRATIILKYAHIPDRRLVAEQMDVDVGYSTVSKCCTLFRENGIAGLRDAPKGRRPALSDAEVAQLMEDSIPVKGQNPHTIESLSLKYAVSPSTISRTLRRNFIE